MRKKRGSVVNIEANVSDLKARGTLYDRYKQTTRGFKYALVKLLPETFRLTTVSDLARAADFLFERSESNDADKEGVALKTIVDRSLLEDLEESITLREAVGATYANDSPHDDGHYFMIDTLKYCHKILAQCRRKLRIKRSRARDTRKSLSTPKRKVSNHQENDSALCNAEGVGSSFGILQIDSDSDSDSSIDSTIEAAAVERPEEPATDYSIEEDLIEGSWAFQANLFFLSAENLFAIVAEAYETLRDGMNNLKSSGEPFAYINHHTITLLMQATAKVNLAIEHMRCLEKSFFLDREPLHNVHHVFAILFFSQQVKELEEIVGPQVLEHHPYICVNLASFCVRFGFLGCKIYLMSGAIDSLLKDLFVKKNVHKHACISQQQREKVKKICLTICASADFERLIDPAMFDDESLDKPPVCDIRFHNADGTLAHIVEVLSSNWLKKHRWLGGPSGIVYTYAQLESNAVGSFTSPESFDKACSTEVGLDFDGTREILDNVCAMRLLPYLLLQHKQKQIKELPGVKRSQDHFSLCAPVLRDFDHMMDKPGREIDFSLAFGIHALVLGMSMLQEEDNARRIAVTSKLALLKFEKQLSETTLSSSYLSNIFDLNLDGVGLPKQLLSLNKFVALPDGKRGLERALWNPLLAGSFLLTITFHSNLQYGFDGSDVFMQIRTTLHLYNALHQRHLIPKLDVLEMLTRTLDESKTIWPEGHPERGNFLISFFLAGGDFTRVVDQYMHFLKVEDSNEGLLNEVLAPRLRKIRFGTKHLSESQQNALVRVYHLYCLRYEFGKLNPAITISSADVVCEACRYFVKDFPRESSNWNEIGTSECALQVDLLSNSIGSEHECLSINWHKAGLVLDGFVESLLDELGINPLIDEYLLQKVCSSYIKSPGHEKMYRRDTANKFLADMIFRELDFQDDDDMCANSRRAAGMMIDFFTKNVTTESITFF